MERAKEKGPPTDGYNTQGKGGGKPGWMPQRGPPGQNINLMGEDPSQWVVGPDGRVVKKQGTGVNMAVAWNNPGWGYSEWDQSYGQGWPQDGMQAAAAA